MVENRVYNVVVRVYTPKPEEVEGRIDRAMEHVRYFRAVREQFPALSRLVFLVPNDYDCGNTWHALRMRLYVDGLAYDKHVVTYTERGHHSCEVLNYGMGVAEVDASHALIVSGKAMAYLTVPAMRAIDEAFANGAKVAGLAVDELRDIVLQGRLQNTFTAWDIDALHQVRGFDSRTGVEEIAPLARLIRKFGRCIAPIGTRDGTLDIHESETARARHHEVMTTKLAREQDELARVGSCLSEITAGIMPGYPRYI